MSLSGAALRRWALLVLIALVAVTSTACAGAERAGNGIRKNGDNELRTDLEPLVTRLPRLSDAPSAQWMSGHLGDDRVPGPATYWIDAVVVLDDATLDEAAAVPGLAVAKPPGVVSGLEPSLPEGDLLRSEELDRFFSNPGWFAQAWLSAEEGQVVLLVVGE